MPSGFTVEWLTVVPSLMNEGQVVHTRSHYGDVIMRAIASQLTSLTIVYSAVYPSADQRKHQSSGSLAFVRGIHWGPVNSPHKWPVTRKMFPFDDVIMTYGAQMTAMIMNANPAKETLTTKSRHFDNFVVTCGTVSCRNDNLRCHQGRQSCQIDDLLFSVKKPLDLPTHPNQYLIAPTQPHPAARRSSLAPFCVPVSRAHFTHWFIVSLFKRKVCPTIQGCEKNRGIINLVVAVGLAIYVVRVSTDCTNVIQ